MSKGIERLTKVMPANMKGLGKSAKQGDIPNISTQPVLETKPFDSHKYESNFRDQAGLGAEHLNLAAATVNHGAQELKQLRSELSEQTRELSRLELPDTQIMVDGQKIEVPFHVKQYACDIDQERYMRIMWGLLGATRIVDFQKHATKSNQNNTPALWLNQAIAIEVKKPYVYQIRQNVGQQIKDEGLDNIAPEVAQTASNYLDMALGSHLRGQLAHIAQTQDLSILTVFVLIVDEILKSRNVTNVPLVASSLWANPFGEDEEEVAS